MGIVLHADNGHKILTERLRDGSVTWEEDPEDLEDRNSLAKVTRSIECSGAGISVECLERYKTGAAEDASAAGAYASPGECRQYAAETLETFRRYAEREEHVELPSLQELAREMRENLQENLQNTEPEPQAAGTDMDDEGDLVD